MGTSHGTQLGSRCCIATQHNQPQAPCVQAWAPAERVGPACRTVAHWCCFPNSGTPEVFRRCSSGCWRCVCRLPFLPCDSVWGHMYWHSTHVLTQYAQVACGGLRPLPLVVQCTCTAVCWQNAWYTKPRALLGPPASCRHHCSGVMHMAVWSEPHVCLGCVFVLGATCFGWGG